MEYDSDSKKREQFRSTSNNERYANALAWMLKETISMQEWHAAAGNAKFNRNHLCIKCELERNTNKQVRGFEALLAECNSASGGNQVIVPSFTIDIEHDRDGQEIYTVSLSSGNNN